MMRKLLVLFLSLIMVMSAFGLAYADDMVYFLDSTSGDLVVSGNAAADAAAGIVRINEDCNYDKAEKLYVYPTESSLGASVRTNIYDGMVTTDSVYISADQGAMISVYNGDTVLEDDQLESIQEPGVYVVRDDSCDQELFRFTIVKYITSALQLYLVPDIFYIGSVKFNGADMNQVGNQVTLSEDGDYEITYANDTISQKYTLELKIDHTAPQLLISGVNEKGIANSTVRFGEMETNSSLVIERDGEVIVQSDELKTAGDYIVTYSDEAGNEVVYTFTIHFFLDAGGIMYVILLAMIAGAGVFYYFYTKKKLRTC